MNRVDNEVNQLLLTEREHQVMLLAVEGLGNHQIAERLGISHRTVETHKARVLQKMGAASVVDLIRMTDARLKADARMLADLYENAPCGYHSLGPDGTILKINATELGWLGYRREEIVGCRKLVDFLTSEGRAIFASNFPRLIETGKLTDLRFDLICRDGSFLPVLVSATALYDEAGRFQMSRSIVHDQREQLRIESQLREAQRIARLGNWGFDPLAGQMYCSDEMLRLYGLLPLAQQSLTDYLDRLHPDDRGWTQARLIAAVDGDKPFEFTHRVLGQNAGLAYIRVFGHVVRRPDGLLSSISGTAQDVTEATLQAKALQQAEERYRTVVEDQTEVISRFLADGTFVFVNDVYARFFGKRKEQLIGGKWHPVAHPDDVARIEQEMKTLAPDHPVVVIENRVYSGTGEVRWMQFVNRGFFAADGVLHEIQSVGRDITERRQAEEAEQQAHARCRYLADANLVGVVMANAQGDILEANDYYLNILGLSRDDLLAGRVSWKEMTPPEWLDADYRNLAELAAHGVGPPYEKEYVRADGSRRAVYLANAMLPGESGQIIAVVVDITERKREAERLWLAEQAAQQANEAKSHFLAAVSHDLKQPLAALAIYAGMLKGVLPPGNEALAVNIGNCVGSLSAFLSDLLDLSKFQLGGQQPTIRDFDIVDLFDQIASYHAPEARRKNLSLRYRRLPLTARTDVALLGRLLSNLVANAIRYTDAGGVLIACRRRQGRYWVEVWDTGIGIPADRLSEVFEAFRQLDCARQPGRQGSGLGLSIVDQIAKLLGLELRVRSSSGRGSLFAVELPLA